MSEILEDDEWQPPTESELKVFQARRERSDKVSKLMGDYLLKGYKMLGVCCGTCDTILLQDKQGVNYCVACQELDADNVKDDPALSDEAALRQAAEQNQRSDTSSQDPSPTDHRDILGQLPESSAEPASNSVIVPDPRVARRVPAEPTEGAHQPKLTISRHPGCSHGDVSARGMDDAQAEQPQGAEGGNSQGQNLVSPDLTRNVPKPTASDGYHFRAQMASEPYHPRAVADTPVQETSGSVRPRMEPVYHSNYLRNVTSHTTNQCDILDKSLTVLYYKLQRATVELEQNKDVRYCSELCAMIKNCAEALEALNKVKNQKL